MLLKRANGVNSILCVSFGWWWPDDKILTLWYGSESTSDSLTTNKLNTSVMRHVLYIKSPCKWADPDI